VPAAAVNVWSTRAVPAIVGGTRIEGGSPGSTTTVVAVEKADTNPTSFVAVSRTRMVAPTSSAPST
jgi:hypothetical protein